MVLTVSFVAAPETGFIVSVIRKIISRRLDISVGMSGPHDFAVRETGALVCRAARVHRIPPSRS